MRHLTLEALARLVDEAPDAMEEAHLATCPACRAELEALRDQTEALGTLPELMPGPDAWPALRDRLREEGVVRSPGRRAWRPSPALTRMAAALALFVAGGATGFLVRGPLPGPAGAVAGAPDGAADRLAGGGPAAPRTGSPGDAALPGDPGSGQDMFAAALDQFMQASDGRVPDPAARLAALDNIVLTTAEALNESPGDPVINSYHLTAVAQRDELLRQLSASAGEPVF